ncbi:FadR/GntR family transcriptional regulator [Shewanella donghaensis]|uniref:FadR/GntR family transcriptional regulator n=1 Tax=Shewanella donghaensis TaxID=238836 RepID=UPI001183DE18|nr:FadR/GntR family transcriptional regulator [Shewanella donghaensis]
MSELIYYDLKCTQGMSPSLSVQVAKELGRRIVSGAFEAQSLIDDENALASRYHVSRVVVRDAVKILVSKGLLEVRRGIGTRVQSRDKWNMLDDDILAWHLSAPPNLNFLKQLMDVRLAFEPKAARWAAERATDADIAEIAKAVEGMAQASSTAEDFIIADSLFHKAVMKAANNGFLASMEGVIYSALLVSIKMTNKDPRDNGASVPFHRDVYEAILKRDGDKAEKLTEKLLNDASIRLSLSQSDNN